MVQCLVKHTDNFTLLNIPLYPTSMLMCFNDFPFELMFNSTFLATCLHTKLLNNYNSVNEYLFIHVVCFGKTDVREFLKGQLVLFSGLPGELPFIYSGRSDSGHPHAVPDEDDDILRVTHYVLGK